MENMNMTTPTTINSSAAIANQRIIIIILTIILIFSLLGNQSLTILNNLFSSIIKLISNLIVYLTSNLGYTTGSILQTTSNIASNAAISTAQIADGTIDDIGGIFRDANLHNVSPGIKTEMDQLVNSSQNFLLLPPPKGEVQLNGGGGLFSRTSAAPAGSTELAALRRDLDEAINKINSLEKPSAERARADTDDSPIQKPITAMKAGWCLAGEYQGKRGCVEVAAGDRCMSGKFFESKDLCLK